MKTSLRYKTKYDMNPYVNKKKLNNHDEIIAVKPSNANLKQFNHHIIKYKEIDNTEFLKLYSQYVAQWTNITKRAKTILMWVLGEVKPAKDIIHIDVSRIMSETVYKSLGSVYSGINELVESGLIARTTIDNLYYINTNFIFDCNKIVFSEVFEKKLTDEYVRTFENSSSETTKQVNHQYLPKGFNEGDKKE